MKHTHPDSCTPCTHTHTQDITSWYHMVTHCYQAASSPTWVFLLPGIHWGKKASVTQCEHTAAIVCLNTVMSQPLHFKHWQPVGGYRAEEAWVGDQLWIVPQISHNRIRQLQGHTTQRCAQLIIYWTKKEVKHAARIVMTALVLSYTHKCKLQYFLFYLDTCTQRLSNTHTHTVRGSVRPWHLCSETLW